MEAICFQETGCLNKASIEELKRMKKIFFEMKSAVTSVNLGTEKYYLSD